MAEKKPKIWHVQFKYGDTHSYATAAGVIGYVKTQIANLKDFCIKFNSEGLDVLDRVQARVGDLENLLTYGGMHEPVVNECFDEHSNGRIMFRAWKDKR